MPTQNRTEKLSLEGIRYIHLPMGTCPKLYYIKLLYNMPISRSGEMADTHDPESCAHYERAGSSPVFGT